MVKRTIPEMAEHLAEATGLSNSSLRSISRRLREARLLSQFGHGRGAAAATAGDAATLLLVAATEFPPLHAALVGQALLSCKADLERDDEEDTLYRVRLAEPFFIKGDIPKNPIQVATSLIEHRDRINEIAIWFGNRLSVQFVKHLEDEPSKDKAWCGIDFQLPFDASIADEFESKLGGRQRHLSRRHYIDGQVLLDIADWLGAEEEDQAGTAA